MKKINLFLSLITVFTLFSVSGCNAVPIDPDAIASFDSAESKISNFVNDICGAAVNEQSTKSTRSIKRNEETTDNTILISSDSVESFYDRILFCKYVYNNVYYCVKYQYELNKINLEDGVYGPTTHAYHNEMYESYLLGNNTSIPLSLKINKEDDGYSFKVDWDYRSDYIKKNSIVNYANYLINGKLVVDPDTNEIKQYHYCDYKSNHHGSFEMGCIDFENSKFAFIDMYMKPYKNISCDSKETGVYKYLNEGLVTYENFFNYSVEFCKVFKGNIANNLEDIGFKSYSYTNSNALEHANKADYIISETNCTESEFASTYNEVYNQLRTFKLRGDNEQQSTARYKRVNFLNDCLFYGEETTNVFYYNVGLKKVAKIPFIRIDLLKESVQNKLESDEQFEQREILNYAFTHLKAVDERNYANLLKGQYNLKLLYFQGDKPEDFRYCFKTEEFIDAVSFSISKDLKIENLETKERIEPLLQDYGYLTEYEYDSFGRVSKELMYTTVSRENVVFDFLVGKIIYTYLNDESDLLLHYARYLYNPDAFGFQIQDETTSTYSEQDNILVELVSRNRHEAGYSLTYTRKWEKIGSTNKIFVNDAHITLTDLFNPIYKDYYLVSIVQNTRENYSFGKVSFTELEGYQIVSDISTSWESYVYSYRLISDHKYEIKVSSVYEGRTSDMGITGYIEFLNGNYTLSFDYRYNNLYPWWAN